MNEASKNDIVAKLERWYQKNGAAVDCIANKEGCPMREVVGCYQCEKVQEFILSGDQE